MTSSLLRAAHDYETAAPVTTGTTITRIARSFASPIRVEQSHPQGPPPLGAKTSTMQGSPVRHTRTVAPGFIPIARSIAASLSFRQCSQTFASRPVPRAKSETGGSWTPVSAAAPTKTVPPAHSHGLPSALSRCGCAQPAAAPAGRTMRPFPSPQHPSPTTPPQSAASRSPVSDKVIHKSAGRDKQHRRRGSS